MNSADRAGETLVRAQLKKLFAEDERERAAAAEELGRIGPAGIPAGVVPALATSLEHEVESVRCAAAEALGQIGSADAMPVLRSLLRESESFEMRFSSALSLGQIGHPGAVPDLIALLRDENAELRAVAADALGSIGSEAAVGALAGRAAVERDPDVLNSIAAALAAIGSPDGLPALDALAGRDRSLDFFAIALHGIVGTPAVAAVWWLRDAPEYGRAVQQLQAGYAAEPGQRVRVPIVVAEADGWRPDFAVVPGFEVTADRLFVRLRPETPPSLMRRPAVTFVDSAGEVLFEAPATVTPAGDIRVVAKLPSRLSRIRDLLAWRGRRCADPVHFRAIVRDARPGEFDTLQPAIGPWVAEEWTAHAPGSSIDSAGSAAAAARWFEAFCRWSFDAEARGIMAGSLEADAARYWEEWLAGALDGTSTPAERLEIERVGATPAAQKAFVRWLSEAFLPARLAAYPDAFPALLADLKRVEPFRHWEAVQVSERAGIRLPVVIVPTQNPSDAVLTELSAVAVPAPGPPGPGGSLFDAESGAFPDEALREASRSVRPLLLALAAFWLLAGGLRGRGRFAILRDGFWVLAALLLAILLSGIGDSVAPGLIWAAGLAWLAAVACDFGFGCAIMRQAVRETRRAWSVLRKSQIRVRLSPPIRTLGRSCGGSLSLAAAHATLRAGGVERVGPLRAIAERFAERAGRWPVTARAGALGFLLPVDLTGKKAPVARDADKDGIVTAYLGGADRLATGSARPLRQRRCFHLAQALLVVAGDWSNWRLARNVAALVFSLLVIAAAPDARCVIDPPPAPRVVAPSGRAPNRRLWVSLDTARPNCFCVRLDSGYWAYRKADVNVQGAEHPRAEVPFSRRPDAVTADPLDGMIRVELRNRLLFRDFGPGPDLGAHHLSSVERAGTPADSGSPAGSR